eukprot:TRINITY_DN7455_c0_g1_i1.p1 TRINITY_DN7455_c0_g1~~TRINITY_DN7455_c0_g1_i1.p1  ORF type:complete len:180 (+),score=69.77 TRINITY_DN7455_c0_g1_i1:83-622(+)
MFMALLKGLGGGAVLCVLEEKVVKATFPQLYEKSLLGLPKLYGLSVIVNVVASTWVLLMLGMKVGAARRKFSIDLPKMQAEGDSDLARKFNCVQRGHQQALETYTSFLALALFGGIRHPLTSTLSGLLWCISRLKWADGYASGDPAARYTSFWSTGFWNALLGMMSATVSTGLAVLDVC